MSRITVILTLVLVIAVFVAICPVIAQTSLTLPSSATIERPVSPAKPTVIVIRPNAWHAKLATWSSYRSAEYQLQFIDSSANPYLLRNAVLAAVAKASTPVEAIVLCGDVAEAPADAKDTAPMRAITPTFSLDTSVKLGQSQTPTLVTDSLYGDIDDDGCPELAVGRLPAKTDVELERMLSRSIDYERSNDVGIWRDRVHVTAGVGGFGMLADAAIESVARRYLTEGIPDRFQLQMTYASLTSPYCPDPTKLKDTFLNGVNRGGIFWVYIGHGWIDCLDRFTYGKTEELICSAEDAKRFQCPSGPPVAVLLACYTGAYDAKVDCFAERLLQQPNGPIAVVAGSRVTMPYGLSQLAGEMLESCFVERTATLGRIVADAKKAVWLDEAATSIDSSSASKTKLKTQYQKAIEQMAKSLSPPDHSLVAERREHVRLMNLLGDPLLKIRHPQNIEIDCDDSVDAGNNIRTRFDAPWAGKVSIELFLNRDRLPTDLVSVGNYVGTIEQHARMQANYEHANQLRLWSKELVVEKGSNTIEIPMTAEMRGKYVLRVRMQSDGDWAIGAKRMTVRRVKEPAR